ncbi:GIY-YIG nuclease family protein [Chryseobacterium arthrosphaerae]|uniref:GIY-YIG nuclease family protein n=1 Tax=Chryseobacterium arthrosphaerae TaxID=651561 RepID=UPI001F4A46B1|nr:GIY-YIG nuclease family protein [Chryseobacterium arthrosphaerae]
MAFDIDFQERGFIKEHIWKFLLYPEHWNDPDNNVTVGLTWSEVPFNRTQLSNVPNTQKGIYCFVVKPTYNQMFETRYLFYIGKTSRDFRSRFREYLNDDEGKGKPRMKVFNMLKLWRGYLHFYYAPIADNDDITECENKFINTFIPKVNSDIPKARIKPELINIYQ